jgi:hypothetical protein
MATHDYDIANADGATVRQDINNVLDAIVSNNSNATSPATTYAYQWWADTTSGKLKIRNAANNAWIEVGTLATASLGLLSSSAIGSTVQGYDADTAKLDVAQSFTATQTLKGITETEATNSTTAYTVNLTNGTIFDLTNAAQVTVTMPSVGAGKSFTIITKTAPAWAGTTILWSGGTVPSATTISIYSFLSDGTSWYGMEAGSGFA